MQKLLLSVFVATCGMLVMNGCGPGTEGDAGVEDAGGGEGEGEGEGEDPPGAESDTCDPTDADSCESPLICVPGQLTPTVGTCRVDCSADAAACPSNRTCQDVLSADLIFLATACLPQQTTRDAQCLAWNDPDACGDGMACHLTNLEQTDTGNEASFNCKITCDKTAADLDAECAGDERCFESALIQDFQTTEDGANILPCTIANCEEGGTGCECDVANDFECIELNAGPGCVKVPGQCGNAVPPLQPENVVAGGITQELICNTVDDHAFCDDSMVAEDSDSICISGIFGAADPNPGICFALCSTPTADYDEDGTIAGDEEGNNFACAAEWQCGRETARRLGLGVTIADDSVPGGAKLCSPSECTAGEPCPGECGGSGDYECVTFGTGADAESICFAPYGSCEFVGGGDTDAGPQDDAGTVVDAGGGEVDAGGGDVDAGDTTDAGVDDAGAADAN